VCRCICVIVGPKAQKQEQPECEWGRHGRRGRGVRVCVYVAKCMADCVCVCDGIVVL